MLFRSEGAWGQDILQLEPFKLHPLKIGTELYFCQKNNDYTFLSAFLKVYCCGSAVKWWKWETKWNWEDPGSLPTPGNLFFLKKSICPTVTTYQTKILQLRISSFAQPQRKCNLLLNPGVPDGIFSKQNSQFGLILDGLPMEDVSIFWSHLVNITAIWYILWTFGIFYGHLVYFMPIWYILWPFGMLY
jgi:hypothetical protein